MKPTVNIGDPVRENWSGIVGTVVDIVGSQAAVQYPSRRLTTPVAWLVQARPQQATVGATPADANTLPC